MMRVNRMFVAFLMISLLPAVVAAVVVTKKVTPEFLRRTPGEFTMSVDASDVALTRFTVTRDAGDRQRYVVAAMTVRDQEKVISRSVTTSYLHGGVQTLMFEIVPEFAADSFITISERPFSVSDDKPVPLPSGTDYVFRLADYVPGNSEP